MPRVTVHVFDEIRERLGRKAVTVVLPAPATLGVLLHTLATEVDPLFAELGPTEAAPYAVHAVLVNGRRLQLDRDEATPLADGDQVYLIPPIAGGAVTAVGPRVALEWRARLSGRHLRGGNPAMQEPRDALQDPGSGYASADVFDPEAPVNRPSAAAEPAESLQDPMSGYASADTLDPAAPVNRHRAADEGPEEPQAPMSGYASGDLLGPDRPAE
ncbi:MAG: MoaD/ThiS family protein [Chloroflexi bacterium]|nr:MoaD/ThiS family protein [Chloroflexota bacterium]